MLPPCGPLKELFFVMSPIPVFLVEVEMFLPSDTPLDLVLNDLVQSTLVDPANHQVFPVHKSDHPLHGIDPDILHALTYVM